MRLQDLRVAFLACCLLATGCDRGTPTTPTDTSADVAEPEPTEECILTMGWDPWEPYHYMDPTGEVRGLDVEIVSAAARDVGCELRFERDAFANLLFRLRNGDIDLITGATITPEREEFATFSEPCRTETFALYVRAGESGQFAGDNLESLLEKRMRIGITNDYIYGDPITALQSDPDYAALFVGAELGEINADRLVNMEIDGFLEDKFVASTVMRRRGLEEDIEAHPLDLGLSGDVHLMFSKASVPGDLVARINESLARLNENGDIARLSRRYLP